MIVIKHIETFTTDKDRTQLFTHHPDDFVSIDDGADMIQVETLMELIEGTRFHRPSDGTDIVIGMSKQAQNVIGIQYEAWENQTKALDAAHKNIRQLEDKLTEIVETPFFSRVKWLFKFNI